MLTGLSVYLPESLLTVFDNLEFLIRIVLAAILGAMVGLERTKQQKDAGIRTHCIVALTSAVFMILSKYAFIDVVALAGSKGADPSRIENDRQLLANAVENRREFLRLTSIAEQQKDVTNAVAGHAQVA